MTSMYISRPSGESWDWKRRAERLVRASGHPYTIVRPGWFDYQGPQDTQIDLRQGDLVEGRPGVDRHHIAQVLIEGALNPSGEHRTVEVFSRAGEPVTDFEALFAATLPDTESGRGALDRVLVPVEDEPARLHALHAALLADGGRELMALKAYDFAPLYAWVQDRYGMTWQLAVGSDEPGEDPSDRAAVSIVPSLLFDGRDSRAAEALRTWVEIMDRAFGSSRPGAFELMTTMTKPDLSRYEALSTD